MGKTWTKQDEREQLLKIQELIEETEVGSYIRMSFSGICEMCARNIEEDSANNMPDAIEYMEEQIRQLRQKYANADAKHGEILLKVEHERDVYAEQLKQSREAYEEKHKMWCKATDAVAELEKTVDDYDNIIVNRDVEIENLKSEIILLKARLYDYMQKEIDAK